MFLFKKSYAEIVLKHLFCNKFEDFNLVLILQKAKSILICEMLDLIMNVASLVRSTYHTF